MSDKMREDFEKWARTVVLPGNDFTVNGVTWGLLWQGWQAALASQEDLRAAYISLTGQCQTALEERDAAREENAALRARIAEAERQVVFWKDDSAAAWNKCEERRLEAESLRACMQKPAACIRVKQEFDWQDAIVITHEFDSPGDYDVFARPIPPAEKKQAHCMCEACKGGTIHDSDCSVHNGPAMPKGQCDCSVAEEKELVACECGDQFRVDSYGAGFLAAVGRCQSCQAAKDSSSEEKEPATCDGKCEGWRQFNKLRAFVAKQRYPGLEREVFAASAEEKEHKPLRGLSVSEVYWIAHRVGEQMQKEGLFWGDEPWNRFSLIFYSKIYDRLAGNAEAEKEHKCCGGCEKQVAWRKPQYNGFEYADAFTSHFPKQPEWEPLYTKSSSGSCSAPTGVTADAEAARLRAALLTVARMAEALKRECGMDPESPQALRNAEYMNISYAARAAIAAEEAKKGVGK